jgi:hypothetical protein
MLYNNAFKVNYYTLAIQLMPTKWRKPIHMAFVKVLVSPFVLMLKQFNNFRTETIYKLQHDSRIGSIEKVLNDQFDFIERRIIIVEGQRLNHQYSYYSYENKEQLETPFYSYSPGEISSFSADFEIWIPTAVGLIESDITRLETIAKYYTDKDKHFTIKTI